MDQYAGMDRVRVDHDAGVDQYTGLDHNAGVDVRVPGLFDVAGLNRLLGGVRLLPQ
jgi:hypothetical protein